MRHEGHHVRVRCFVCWWYGPGVMTWRAKGRSDGSWRWLQLESVRRLQKRRGSAALRMGLARSAIEGLLDGKGPLLKMANSRGSAGSCGEPSERSLPTVCYG